MITVVITVVITDDYGNSDYGMITVWITVTGALTPYLPFA